MTARLPTSADNRYDAFNLLNEFLLVGLNADGSIGGGTGMGRLPIIDGDKDNWGTVLNDFLLVGHNDDGTLKISGAGYGMSTYGDLGWETTTIDQGYTTTTNLAMAKMVYGQVGWGGKLNAAFDLIDALGPRVTALEG